MNDPGSQKPKEGHATALSPAAIGFTLGAAALAWMLVRLVFGGFGVQLEYSKRDRARDLEIPAIQSGLDQYFSTHGRYPALDVGLKALVDAQVFEKLPIDPWDRPYVYLLENERPLIVSLGRDGVLGTDDDLSSERQ